MPRRVRNLRGTNAPQGIAAIPPGAEPHGTRFVSDHTFPLPVVLFFVQFLSEGLLADGTKTEQPLLSKEEAHLYLQPYSRWAPEGHRGRHRAESVLNHVMSVLTGLEDLLLGSWSLEQELHLMKSRLLQGLVPMSDRRWQQKQLDDPANMAQACQHLSNVVDAFGCINREPFASRIRERYNRMWDHTKQFERALNAKRAAEGQVPVRVMPLWDEYVKKHFDFVSDRAHAWILKRVDRLQELTLERMGNTGHALGPNNFSAEQVKVGDDMQDLSEIMVQADASCMISTAGFKSEWVPPNPPPPPRQDWNGYDGKTPITSPPADLATRVAVHGVRIRWLNRIKIMEQTMQPGPWRGTTSDAADMVWTMKQQLVACSESRKELRGDPPVIRTEHWISQTKSQIDSGVTQAWGFVGYRLHYKHSADEWKRFLDAFRKDVQAWDRGVVGSLWIKRLCRMRWFDGQELGIPEGDIDAARRHFKTFAESSDWIKGLIPSNFLIADEAAIESYINPGPEFMEPGDNGGFVVLADASFNPSELPTDAPTYDGTLRVLGSLLWDDVYAGLSRTSFRPHDLWACAMIHPLHIYIGPLTKHQRQYFRRMNWFRNQVLVAALRWKAEKPTSSDS